MLSEEEAKLLSMFAKTRVLIKDGKNRENAICSAVLEGAECYCNAILSLLNRNSVFPAKALMRCLCELAVKLMWCLQCRDDTNEVQDRKTVDEKVHRWEKSTLAQNIKVLKEWKQVDPKNNKIDDLIRKLEKKKDNMNVKEMPRYAQLLETLPDDFRRGMSVELYMDCNKAVHLSRNA
ncbi:MAG: DUF5677 domain-containing protein [Planctomycetota bacterium]|jgi:hypothetical protein